VPLVAEDRYAGLAGALANDQLVVNADSANCGYLTYEAELLVPGFPPGNCGGRTLDEDVIERSYSVLAAGVLEGVDDGVEANDVENLDAFPYVAPPSE
jgi:hypothetical protein